MFHLLKGSCYRSTCLRMPYSQVKYFTKRDFTAVNFTTSLIKYEVEFVEHENKTKDWYKIAGLIEIPSSRDVIVKKHIAHKIFNNSYKYKGNDVDGIYSVFPSYIIDRYTHFRDIGTIVDGDEVIVSTASSRKIVKRIEKAEIPDDEVQKVLDLSTCLESLHTYNEIVYNLKNCKGIVSLDPTPCQENMDHIVSQIIKKTGWWMG